MSIPSDAGCAPTAWDFREPHIGTQSARSPCAALRPPHCRNAASPTHRLQSNVQKFRRQGAADAALLVPCWHRCALVARLAVGRGRGRGRERMREAETEGQIKGVARPAPPRQSARGFAAAPQGLMRVPRRDRNPRSSGGRRVLLPMRCATVRWSPHGWQ
jgi:hypothetical protein